MIFIINRWITETQIKEENEDKDNNDDDNDDIKNDNNNNNKKNKQKDINFNQKYKLSKHADILKFLLHRDKFLHISAVGSKQEMHNYMRQQLRKFTSLKYNNSYSKEIIENLSFEANSIAYYVDDWKLLYYLKMFPNQKLHQIPVQLQRESYEKYSNIIKQCQSKNNQNKKSEIDINEEDNNNDVEMNGNEDIINEDNSNRLEIERKRRTRIDNNIDKFTDNLNINNEKKNSPRKKRKISEKTSVNHEDDRYNTAHLKEDAEYLTNDEKLALYKAFEFTTLIESVWNLSRKSFITAFINIELDLPTMSGLQSCVELGWSVFPRFKELTDDISGDFDDILSLYKDFNKEKQIRSSARFANSSLLAHQHANNSDDDAPMQNGVSLAAINAAFKWEDYDTLDDDTSTDEEETGVGVSDVNSDKAVTPINLLQKTQEVIRRERTVPQFPSAVRTGASLPEWGFITQMNQSVAGKNDSDDEKNTKQQKGRFVVDGGNNNNKEDKEQGKKKMDEDDDDDDNDEYGSVQEDEYAYGDYDDIDDDIRFKEEERDIDGYIGYMNRKEFKLEMKKRRIIRRSKTKEYKDRIDKYGTCEFLYGQIQPFIDQPKKKRSKHKYVYT